MQRDAARQRQLKTVMKVRKGAAEVLAGAQDADVNDRLAVLDEQSRELHAIALDMCDEIAETIVHLHEPAAGRCADGITRRVHAPGGGPTESGQSFVTLSRQKDVRRNHRRGRARPPADRDVRRRSGKRTAQKALLKRLDKELAVIYDDLNLPVAVGTCAEQLRMAASLLELWRTCVVVIDRVPLKAIPDGVFRTVMLLINRSPHDVSSAAPSSSLTTRSSTTPTRPASFPATSLPSPSAAGR